MVKSSSKGKKTTKKSSAKNTNSKKIEVVVEKEEVIEVPKKEPIGYFAPIQFLREPAEKNIPCGDMYYHKYSNTFELRCSAPQYHSDLEMLMAGDIRVETDGKNEYFSKKNSPVGWIINLHKSVQLAGNPFIAGEAQEVYET